MKIDDKYKWLARDKNGDLYCFVNKPFKRGNYWDWHTGDYYNGYGLQRLEETDERFDFIRWNDDNPIKISNIGNILAIDSNNIISKPSHYIGINGLEVEQILAEFLPKIEDSYVAHRVGSAIEYLLRSSEKNGIQDIEKAGQNIEQIKRYLDGKQA